MALELSGKGGLSRDASGEAYGVSDRVGDWGKSRFPDDREFRDEDLFMTVL